MHKCVFPKTDWTANLLEFNCECGKVWIWSYWPETHFGLWTPEEHLVTLLEQLGV